MTVNKNVPSFLPIRQCYAVTCFRPVCPRPLATCYKQWQARHPLRLISNMAAIQLAAIIISAIHLFRPPSKITSHRIVLNYQSNQIYHYLQLNVCHDYCQCFNKILYLSILLYTRKNKPIRPICMAFLQSSVIMV